MLKSNSNFKLSKTVKRMMASHSDINYSNMLKRNFIQAELAAAIQPKVYKDKRNNSETE